MKRRSLFYRILCAIFGMTAARLQASGAAEVALALKPQNLKWTVWLKSGGRMTVQAAEALHEIVRGVTQDGEPYDISAVVFKDTEGEIVGEVFLDCIKAYGCAYPPVKLEHGYLHKTVKYCAPINP
jgi:hypothetical protein